MKNSLHKNKKTHLSFLEYGEKSRHIAKKIKTHKTQKANDAIDKALRQKDLSSMQHNDEY